MTTHISVSNGIATFEDGTSMSLSGLITILAEDQCDTDKRLIEAAREKYHRDGEIEIDSTSICSGSGDDGDYVLAWVWVSNEDAGIDNESEDER